MTIPFVLCTRSPVPNLFISATAYTFWKFLRTTWLNNICFTYRQITFVRYDATTTHPLPSIFINIEYTKSYLMLIIQYELCTSFRVQLIFTLIFFCHSKNVFAYQPRGFCVPLVGNRCTRYIVYICTWSPSYREKNSCVHLLPRGTIDNYCIFHAADRVVSIFVSLIFRVFFFAVTKTDRLN